SLGRDSIDRGLKSMIIGGVIVILFMVFYYRVAGILADLALFLNIIFIAAGLAMLGATLTLPGIAGIILIIGMAIDANVLVFERIREELRLGKTPRAAVDSGYSKALVTILDANITTLIAALVLFQFGTGPVKGFAVTLSIGIVASLFTAVFVTRLIFDYLIIERGMSKIRI
ncbi:MAG: SecD/SecF family protein translocase subunit, partial [Desulfobacterales bacterium]|nr:SecD/SecF family protein translocase subunit [Desulfobacterales bacterium]